ncbi:MAG: division/cell wall cluster transcriptional repressor MraZ [Acidobacteria bacterium]|jgi:MraZ protein|nr:MAG: division/cell wall cluster transcriptional repressor MraZ [Acidobacteriota bacterium]GIU82917.1 MAG: transcriptional regulator MraZ [Pyrinomonadaceae bacterium]
MLRGNYTAKVDEKGRLKIPTHFRRKIEQKYGSREVYVTSLTGESVQIFPLQEWETIEKKLALLPTNEKARIIYVMGTSFWGQEAEIDNQGRVLIHPLLRRKAEIYGEVAVLGQLTFLNVWNLEKIEKFLAENPFSEEHAAILARLGI